MPNRTFLANKAIAIAWHKEQELVKIGKGTRNWTSKQQKDILEKGKAYDENGKAFQGQHMKSVETYPEYQSDPNNIQFLTLEEHLAAHGGSWLNPTNWYYDPETKERTIFKSDELIPCRFIELSQPIIPIQANEKSEISSQTIYCEQPQIPESKSEKQPSNNSQTNDTYASNKERWEAEFAKEQEAERKKRNSHWYTRLFDNTLKPRGIKILKDLENPNSAINKLTEVAKNVCFNVLESFQNNTEEKTHYKEGLKEDSKLSTDNKESVTEIKDAGSVSDMTTNQTDSESKEPQEKEYPKERKSPKRHMVNPQKPRRYGSEFKVQTPYVRGEKKEKTDNCEDAENEDDE